MTVLKSIVGLFLGLVIQLSQVQPCQAAESKHSCPPASAHSRSCCEGKAACPCVSKGEQVPTPNPIAPPTVDLKLAAPKLREIDIFALFYLLEFSEAVPATASASESHSGFTGVPLSVAFCTFVI